VPGRVSVPAILVLVGKGSRLAPPSMGLRLHSLQSSGSNMAAAQLSWCKHVETVINILQGGPSRASDGVQLRTTTYSMLAAFLNGRSPHRTIFRSGRQLTPSTLVRLCDAPCIDRPWLHLQTS